MEFGGLTSILASMTGQAQGLGNMLVGAQMMRKAKLAEQELGASPEYTVPESYDEFLGLKKTRARQQMPGYDQMKSDINESTAQTLSGAQNLGGADAAAVLLGAQQSRLSALRQMGLMAMQYREGQQQAYDQAVLGRSPYEEKMYEYNQWLPWQMQKNEIMGQRNMGAQMMTGGWDTMMGSQIQGANMMAQNQWYNNMMGSPIPQSATPAYNWQQQSPQFYNQMQQSQPTFTADPYAMGYGAPAPPSLINR